MPQTFSLGQPFPTLGARVLHAYVASYPAFIPSPEGAPLESQRQLYTFMGDMLEKCYEDPGLIGIASEPDRCFAERWYLNNRDPELMDAMQQIEKKFFNWVGVLHKLGLLGEVREDGLFVPKPAWKLSSTILARLAAFGIAGEVVPEGVLFKCAAYPALFPVLKARSGVDFGKDFQNTLYARFLLGSVPGRPFRASELFGKLYNDPKCLTDLESFFEKLGYPCANDERALKVIWAKEYPGGERGYLHISYRFRDRLQMCYEFRVPAFRLLLENHYSQMDYDLGELCYTRTKVCDNCGYCTQTDKSGRRKKLALPLKYPGGVTLKCPLWPWLTWNEPDADTLAKMQKLFLFAEEKLYGTQHA